MWNNDGWRGGLVSPSHFRLLRRALDIVIFQSKVLLLKFYVNFFNMECPGLKPKKGGYLPLQSLWLLKRALELPITSPIGPVRSLYDHRFYNTLHTPRAYLTTLSLKTDGGGCHPLSYGFRTFQPHWAKSHILLSHNFDLMRIEKW